MQGSSFLFVFLDLFLSEICIISKGLLILCLSLYLGDIV
jgi:hypothetical protein